MTVDVTFLSDVELGGIAVILLAVLALMVAWVLVDFHQYVADVLDTAHDWLPPTDRSES